MPKKGYRMTEEHRQKISISHVGFRKKEKKGWIHNGRKVIYDSEEKREVLEHRYIMEKHIGRKLLRTEIIHHINENPLDNRIENLKIVSRGEHTVIHNTNKDRTSIKGKWKWSDSQREKLFEAFKHRPPQTEESKSKRSESMKRIRKEKFWSSHS